MITEKLIAFVQEHIDDDLRTLAFQGDRYPNIDLPAACRAISARRKLKIKSPIWAQCPDVFIEDPLSIEQCSSERTACYKAQLIPPNTPTGIDLTGGVGIDSYFLSSRFKQWHYLERQQSRTLVAAHNFRVLNALNIQTHTGEAEKHGIELIQELQPNWIYLDPDRRPGKGQERKTALSASSPDILTLLPKIEKRSPKSSFLIKVSPLLDLTYLQSLSWTFPWDIHVVSCDSECRELLICLSPQSQQRIFSVEIFSRQTIVRKAATEKSPLSIYEKAGKFLYDPSPSISKIGLCYFPQLAQDMWQPHPCTSLYMSDKLIFDFPGRVFRVVSSGIWSRQIAKLFSGNRYHLSVRNLGGTTFDFQRRWKIKEGGEEFLHVFKDQQGKTRYTLSTRIHSADMH